MICTTCATQQPTPADLLDVGSLAQPCARCQRVLTKQILTDAEGNPMAAGVDVAVALGERMWRVRTAAKGPRWRLTMI